LKSLHGNEILVNNARRSVKDKEVEADHVKLKAKRLQLEHDKKVGKNFSSSV
jgi:hypothetical protein